MAVYLAPGPFGAGYQAFDSNGDPLNAGKITTYQAGTNTSQATFTTAQGNVTNANPIVLSSDGRPQSSGNLVEIWLTAGISYKFDIKDSTNNQVSVYDNLTGINDIGSQSEWQLSATPTFVSATQFTVPSNLTAIFDVGRRVKAVVTSGTIYGTVSAVSFSTNTTVTVDWDSTQLDSGLSAISYSILDAANPSVPTTRMDQPVETVTAASTLDLSIVRARNVNVVGSTTITRVSIPDGQVRFLQFNNQVNLSNTVSQILTVSSGNTITANTGDVVILRGEPGLSRMLTAFRKDGQPIFPVTSATQAQQETGTITSAPVTPGVQQFHLSAAKFWLKADSAGSILASYNVSSVSASTGILTVTYTTPFSSTNYAAIGTALFSGGIRCVNVIIQGTGSTTWRSNNSADTAADPTNWNLSGFGDQ